MRKSLIVLGGVVVLAGAALVILADPAGPVGLSRLDLGGGDRGWLRDRSIDFLEHLKFKDFKKAATYHLPKTQAERDVPELIRRAFGIKHEILDITEYKILEVDLDRSKTRARVRTQVNFRVLGDRAVRDQPEAVRDIELLLYWFKQPEGDWAMELESSLR